MACPTHKIISGIHYYVVVHCSLEAAESSGSEAVVRKGAEGRASISLRVYSCCGERNICSRAVLSMMEPSFKMAMR